MDAGGCLTRRDIMFCACARVCVGMSPGKAVIFKSCNITSMVCVCVGVCMCRCLSLWLCVFPKCLGVCVCVCVWLWLCVCVCEGFLTVHLYSGTFHVLRNLPKSPASHTRNIPHLGTPKKYVFIFSSPCSLVTVFSPSPAWFLWSLLVSDNGRPGRKGLAHT